MSTLWGQIALPSNEIQWVGFYVIPSILFAISIFTDLKSRKVSNKLILAFLPIMLITQFTAFGVPGLFAGSIAFVAALILTVPMVLTGMLGGGDMKLFAVFALGTNLHAALWVGGTSLIWGALFGVIRAIIKGQGLVLAMNTIGLLKRERPADTLLTKVPYTVALGFGWVTYLSLLHSGGL